MTAATDKPVSEFRRGTKPLVAAMIGVACGASPIPFNVVPLVMGPIHAELGWDFAEISAAITIFGVIAALLAPTVGRLADRHGVRPVALISVAAFAITFAAVWLIPPTLNAWWAIWAVIGVIGIGSTPVTWSRAVSMWFNRHRGLALAIMLLGTSLAALVVPQVVTRAIAAWGWRSAFPVAALFPLLIALPLGLLWFREPRPEERPAGVADASGALVGVSLATALRGRHFWTLWIAIFIIATAYGGAHIHIAQIVGMHGFGPEVAASVLGVVAIGILSGRLIVGAAFDRFWAPGVAFPAMLLPAAACLMLMGTSQSLAMVMIGGLLLGFAAGAESDVIAFLTAKYFGMANYGQIYGMLYLPFGIGSAISPILYGLARDRTGNYDLALTTAMILFFAGGLLLLSLGRYPRLEAQQPAQPDILPEPDHA